MPDDYIFKKSNAGIRGRAVVKLCLEHSALSAFLFLISLHVISLNSLI